MMYTYIYSYVCACIICHTFSEKIYTQARFNNSGEWRKKLELEKEVHEGLNYDTV